MIVLVDLESVSTRYTCQWKTHIPKTLLARGHEVLVVEGSAAETEIPTAGAFLNFAGTQIYKAGQVAQLGHLFQSGQIPAGSHIVFTDAWHPGVLAVKYMSALCKIPVTIHGLWHAGSYDPYDFLGRVIGDAPWVRTAELSFAHAYDINYFATAYHRDLFTRVVCGGGTAPRLQLTGWPMEYLIDDLAPYRGLTKRNLILFPHRLAPEKQVEMFRDLAAQMPQYEWVVCQDQMLSKHKYHTLLGEAKVIWSASLQETFGIAMCAEGPLVGAIPLAPNRLSYAEIFQDLPQWLYPSHWTESMETYRDTRSCMMQRISEIVEQYEAQQPRLQKYLTTIASRYCIATGLYTELAKEL